MEMSQVHTTHVSQLHAFELLPDTLVRVQLWGIRRQALQMQALRRAAGQELLDAMAAVNGGTVPDNDQAVGHLASQVFEERHDVVGIDRVILVMEIQLTLRGDRTDGREMVAGPLLPQDGGLPDGRIGAHHAGEGIEPRFI